MGDKVDFRGDPDGEFEQRTIEAPGGEGFAPVGLSLGGVGAFVAPSLRVEELKDDASVEACGGYSSSSAGSSVYGTDDECPVSGEASDQDGTGRHPSEETGSDFEVPSEELRKKIIGQVEFFFSNENIIHDAFMLKHVRRNKMGYVSLKLVTSFRKVKALSKDYRVVAYCLRSSEKLEVNEEGTKVRRTEPLPDYDETMPSRTIVAANMPFQNPSVEDIAEQFSKFGEIALIRILRPGKQIPQDVKKHLAKHPDLANTIFAVIEYEKHESAKAAFEQVNDGSGDTKKGIKVILLAASKKERANKEEGNKEEDNNSQDTLQSTWGKKKPEVNVPSISTSKEDHKKTKIKNDPKGKAHGRSSLTPVQDPHRLSPGGSPRTTPWSSPKSSPRSSPQASPTTIRRRSAHGPSPLAAELGTAANQETWPRTNYESPSQSPWVQRRLKAKEDNSLGSSSPCASPRVARRAVEGGTEGLKSLDMQRVLRQPKGPDGSKGFHLARSSAATVRLYFYYQFDFTNFVFCT